jgi:hypothetical protein
LSAALLIVLLPIGCNNFSADNATEAQKQKGAFVSRREGIYILGVEESNLLSFETS